MNKMLGGVVALALTVSFTGANAMLRTPVVRAVATGRYVGGVVYGAGAGAAQAGVAWKKTVGVSAVAAIIWYAACNALKNMGDKTETTFTVLGQKITLSKTNLKDIVFGSKVVLGLVAAYLVQQKVTKPYLTPAYTARVAAASQDFMDLDGYKADNDGDKAALAKANVARDRTPVEYIGGVQRAANIVPGA